MKTISPEKIIERLKFFNYKYSTDGSTLIVYLSMLCYLKITLGNNNVKITSHIFRLSPFDRLEYQFLIYAIFLVAIAYYMAPGNPHSIAMLVLLGIFIIYFVICFIKTENMKSIIHNWMDNDTSNLVTSTGVSQAQGN